MNQIGNDERGIDMKGYTEQRCVANFHIQAIKTIIALKRYVNKNNKPAASLTQLVPEFLNTIPVDVFTGELISYNYNLQTIYAQGANSFDNGGQANNFVEKCHSDEKCKNDPTIGIKFSKNENILSGE